MTARAGSAKVYISLVVTAGLATLVSGLSRWECPDPNRYICLFLITALASGLKVQLPGMTGTMSVNFLFILIGIVELGYPEALLMGCTSTAIQCAWRAKSRVRPVKVLFSVGSMAITIAASCLVYRSLLATELDFRAVLALAAAAGTFFIANTFPVAAVVSLTEQKALGQVWRECYFWSFPYYLVGAAIAGLLSTLNQFGSWHISLLALPLPYWVYRSYRQYLTRLQAEYQGRLDAERKHLEEMAGLHLRTIEALALAIEAKDCNTHGHLRRVGVYALEIGKELGLSDAELNALRAAAMLHDIGKLAVPEHIVSKPSKLTPVEFEKMKIHPVVGGEILDRVEFPYPVVPIVRCHHEKWDGSGYPDGLKGEEIPIGARILAAVDCLDALSSDRPYRCALPLDEAIARVASEAGSSFDPQVVDVLCRRYRELDEMVRKQPVDRPCLSTHMKIDRGAAPAAGFEAAERPAPDATEPGPSGFLFSIAAARREGHNLLELTHDLGNSLSLDETLSVLGRRLKQMIPYDSIVVYVRRGNDLVPEYVDGQNLRFFSSLEIPIGEGLAGWVAANTKPIVNGNPSLDAGYADQTEASATLHSALAVPLVGPSGVAGVLALYRTERDFFTKDHLRILLAITEKVALSIENALKYRQAEKCATTDALTGLPNTRSLFLHLDGELARCKRMNTTLSVLVCDLDGFKQVNDRFGHLEGNKLLRALARALKDACREYDYVARMGGDEFVVVLPGHKPEALEAKCQRLAQIAAEVGRQVSGQDILSLSVGRACYPDDGSDAEQLLAEADRRMYGAKQGVQRTGLRSWDLAWQTRAVQ